MMDAFTIQKGGSYETVHAVRQATPTHVQAYCGKVLPRCRCVFTKQKTEPVTCKACIPRMEKEQ